MILLYFIVSGIVGGFIGAVFVHYFIKLYLLLFFPPEYIEYQEFIDKNYKDKHKYLGKIFR